MPKQPLPLACGCGHMKLADGAFAAAARVSAALSCRLTIGRPYVCTEALTGPGGCAISVRGTWQGARLSSLCPVCIRLHCHHTWTHGVHECSPYGCARCINPAMDPKQQHEAPVADQHRFSGVSCTTPGCSRLGLNMPAQCAGVRYVAFGSGSNARDALGRAPKRSLGNEEASNRGDGSPSSTSCYSSGSDTDSDTPY